LYSIRITKSGDDIYRNIVNVSKDVPVTSVRHNDIKEKLSNYFFNVLSTCDDLSSLCEVISLDPQVPSSNTRMFYKVLEGDLNEKNLKS